MVGSCYVIEAPINQGVVFCKLYRMEVNTFSFIDLTAYTNCTVPPLLKIEL